MMNRNSSWEKTLVVGFITILALGLLNAIFFGAIKIHLQCEKSSPGEIYCQLTKTRLVGEVEQTLKPGELKRARLDEDIEYDENGGYTIDYNVVLETQKGKIPFGVSTSWIGNKKERVSQINDFLENTNTTLLDIEQNNLQTLFVSLIIELRSILFMSALALIRYLYSKLYQLYRGIRARLISILDQMNKQPKKAPLSLEKDTQG
ncbi:hypothetical protein ACP6PL_24135 [Dapis sp. BLCC M126]|uniref:hypothetical protein n=1 Tax=Dapis sp. BLCC M126 TaxID=3400189 RepID=UPI003CE6C87A